MSTTTSAAQVMVGGAIADSALTTERDVVGPIAEAMIWGHRAAGPSELLPKSWVGFIPLDDLSALDETQTG